MFYRFDSPNLALGLNGTQWLSLTIAAAAAAGLAWAFHAPLNDVNLRPVEPGRIPMRAIWNETTIAESNETILVEGNHYFPPDSVHAKHLKRSAMRSVCPWKGIAAYYHVEADGAEGHNAAWTYRHPFPWIRKIKNHVAFWGGIEVRP